MNLARCMNALAAYVKLRKTVSERLKARFMMNGKSIHDCFQSLFLRQLMVLRS